MRIFAALWTILLFICVPVLSTQKNDIPTELDPFLELLFETSECESVVGNEAFLVVETKKCKPFTCNFPFEACMRPSHLLNEEKANQCRGIPDACLTAANSGIPVLRPSAPMPTLPFTPPSTRILGGQSQSTRTDTGIAAGDLEGDFEAGDGGEFETSTVVQETTHRPAPHSRIVRPNRFRKAPVCDQGIPNGRFCGFQQKFTFNKATGTCEQFWFPGCRTEDTNDNLFDTIAECKTATRACIAQPQQGRREPEPQVPFVPPEVLGQFGGRVAPEPNNFGNRPDPTNGRGQPEPTNFGPRPDNSNVFGGAGSSNQFKGFMEWAGSALGGNNGEGAQVRPGEYGGGELGSRGSVTQPPNLIRFIANSIKGVGEAQKGGGGNANGAALFTNLLQQLLVLLVKPHQNYEENFNSNNLNATQICTLHRDLGNNKCNKPLWSHRFHFDSKTSRCLSFWFLGCGGNPNNFKSSLECQQLCSGQSRHSNQIFI